MIASATDRVEILLKGRLLLTFDPGQFARHRRKFEMFCEGAPQQDWLQIANTYNQVDELPCVTAEVVGKSQYVGKGLPITRWVSFASCNCAIVVNDFLIKRGNDSLEQCLAFAFTLGAVWQVEH